MSITIKQLDVGETLAVMKDSDGGMISKLIELSIEQQAEQYLLSWQGNEVPRGALLGEHEIVWTQHGVVRNSKGDVIGHYERLVEFGGKSGISQVMLVAMLKKKHAESVNDNRTD